MSQFVEDSAIDRVGVFEMPARQKRATTPPREPPLLALVADVKVYQSHALKFSGKVIKKGDCFTTTTSKKYIIAFRCT